MNENEFRIRLCSDLDYEEMVADICYNDETVGMITQEAGVDQMRIQIFSPPSDSTGWVFSLESLMNVLLSAKNALLNMQKE